MCGFGTLNDYVWNSYMVTACPAGSTPVGYTCEMPLNQEDPDKSAGDDECRPRVGNPCNPATGNKTQLEIDYAGNGHFSVVLARFHNSLKSSVIPGGFGPAWTHRYASRIKTYDGNSAVVVRPDGETLFFKAASLAGPWTADADVNHKLTLVDPEGDAKWILASSDSDETETYGFYNGRLEIITNRAGLSYTLQYDVYERLSTITDPFGRSLSFAYDADNRISSVRDFENNEIAYTYDALGNLTSVRYPGVTSPTRQYQYGDSRFPNALTGIVDENGVQFATWAYDANGKAISSEHAGGAERTQLSYVSDSQTDVTAFVDPVQSATRGYQFEVIWGVKRLRSISGPACPSCGPASITYDSNGNIASTVDWNGNRTNYSYDPARNLETSRTEGLTSIGDVTPQTRTISTAWHASFRLPTGTAEPLRKTAFVYDEDGTQCGARGALCSKTVQATDDANGSQGFMALPVGSPRTWTYTYNANGQLLTVNGPRTDVSDVTTYTYYANDDLDLGKRGNVATITNAAGHTTSITAYNVHGQPLTMVDANGLTITLAYDARQRVTSRTVGGESTSYDYDNAGQLTKVTLPDGSFLSYGYDGAHRLTSVQDNQGNRIAYTLDVAGNRTLEQVFDPANQLAQMRSRIYNNLSRLFQELGALNQTTEYGYDNQGNVTSVRDPLNRFTSNQYDVLNRLKQVTDPALGITQYAYNGLDVLTQVTDPRSLVTGYTVDGLGNLVQQSSPDTDSTVNTYDSAGNLLTKTDAKGQVTTYAYDSLNRVTLIAFHDGSRQTYSYDQGMNGIGRLSSIMETDPANQVTSTIAYAHDQRGRVTSETRILNAVQYVTGYSYDSAGRLSEVAYPSGRTVTYRFDSLGRVAAIDTTKAGTAQALVSNVTYHPFGGVKGYTLGNGQAYSRSYDQDGRIASYTLAATQYAIGYDLASRIEFISDVGNPANSNTYGYDSIDRLTSAVLPGTPFAYNYDAVGNRTSKTVGNATETLTYSATSNRIESLTPATGPVRSFVFDANGSTIADGVNTYAYDARGRMSQATSVIGTTSYQVNALGQRIRKTNSQGDTVFHYDSQGRLIAETDLGGALKREILYLGNIPVGVVQ